MQAVFTHLAEVWGVCSFTQLFVVIMWRLKSSLCLRQTRSCCTHLKTEVTSPGKAQTLQLSFLCSNHLTSLLKQIMFDIVT